MRWDQQGESFVHVGQWDPLVGAVLVFIAAIFEYYAGKNKTEYVSIIFNWSSPAHLLS
jgi:hypothetical protein